MSDSEGETPHDAVIDDAERARRAARNKKKREMKKKKKDVDGTGAVPAASTTASTTTPTGGPEEDDIPSEERQRLWEEQQKIISAVPHVEPEAFVRARAKEHKFWNTQPVPRFEEGFDKEGPMEVKTVEDIRKEPYPLATVLEWSTMDVKNPDQMNEIYELLRDNYVEDDDAMFRFNYPKEFLYWALTPPMYYPSWHIGVRKVSDKSLIAFISGVPCNVRLGATNMKVCEINFLCVHKKVRDKGMAPKLIQEVTRRVNVEGIFQALYTAGVVLPKPIARCQYWHRSLNPKKLIDIGFSRVPHQFQKFRDPMAMTKRHYALSETPKTPFIRPMQKTDVKNVLKILNLYLTKYAIAPDFSVEEAEHWLLPRDKVVYSYVVDHPEKGITDFISFYALPSTVIGHAKYDMLNAAYCYYYVPGSVDTMTLLTDALILASKENFDVFNALDIMDNAALMQELKFGMGDGHLQYYLFNWRFPVIPSTLVGLVML
eukprot:PhF_6_TR20536/c0_g2_i1/m.29643/K00671/NMT; glycylpeptide N-tetradecanoyltransferase